MKAIPDRARAEQAKAAPNAWRSWGRLFGSSKGLATVEEYDRERAHVVALQQSMIAKGCAPLDVNAELATSDAAMQAIRQR
jgi:hypothetical protein